MWLINPLAQTLEALRLDGQFWQEAGTYSGSERVRVEPFETVELNMADWWDVGFWKDRYRTHLLANAPVIFSD